MIVFSMLSAFSLLLGFLLAERCGEIVIFGFRGHRGIGVAWVLGSASLLLAAIGVWLIFIAISAALSHSASTNSRAENVRVHAVIVPELELGDIEWQVFAADLMESPDAPALDQGPKAFDRVGVDGANDVLALAVVDHAMREAVVHSSVADELIGAKQTDLARNGLVDELFEHVTADVCDHAGDDVALALDGADDRRLARIAATGDARFQVGEHRHYMMDGTMALISEDSDIDRARESELQRNGGRAPFGHANDRPPFKGVRTAQGLPPAPLSNPGEARPSDSAFEHRPESNLMRPDRTVATVRLRPPYLICRTTADTLDLIVADVPTTGAERQVLQSAIFTLRKLAE